MDRSAQRGVQHIGLPTACAVVYGAITGNVPDPRDGAAMQALLNEVAAALASVAPIFAATADFEMPQRLSPFYLGEGKFSRGAHVFIDSAGKEVSGLTIQRVDMLQAIRVLADAGIRFRTPPPA